MSIYDQQALITTLRELKIIDEKQLAEAIEASANDHIPLDKILIDKDLIADENIGKLIAELLKIPFVRLQNIVIPPDILNIIPEVVAKKQKIIPFKIDKDGLHVALADPTNIQVKDSVEKKTGLPIKVYFATDRDIFSALSLYSKNLKEAFADVIAENAKIAKITAGEVDPPIIKIVDTILNYAYQNKASDIHIEPTQIHSLVRFRIDGLLHDIITLPLGIHTQIVTRIKVLSKLRTDEHQAAQDGKMQFQTDFENLDIRVSIVPITQGEKLVLRLLSEKSRQFSLSDLGFPAQDLKKVEEAYNKPYGMILSTGPTGCGKTTTMYAILKHLNKRDVNIMTVEDPVEYEIPGINQIQVNLKTNLTFATGLRSILRQDPNIVLVGEIRDPETADIAINSAMTGHLVLSTLHTNDASTSLPRLLDMGIEPFLIASTVNVIIGQRLVRKIHLSCRVSLEVKKENIAKFLGKILTDQLFGSKNSLRLYQGKGCKLCHNTGFEGRIGIFEILILNDQIRQAILNRKDAQTIKNLAVKNGMTTLLDDAFQKVQEGITTIEEIVRVTK
ncbi:type II/IV secretion system protein [Candidatus Gottesmanbacteria bacterium]|nr:type II/IV secretion system protein [Candidatus Gottesmanbacteria bacterium]